MELQVIENQLLALDRQLDVMTNDEIMSKVTIGGDMKSVSEYMIALTSLTGHIYLALKALEQLKSDGEEKECLEDHR